MTKSVKFGTVFIDCAARTYLFVNENDMLASQQSISSGVPVGNCTRLASFVPTGITFDIGRFKANGFERTDNKGEKKWFHY